MNTQTTAALKGEQGILFIRGISNLDCALFDPSSGIVGQSWTVDIELKGGLDEQGFVYDFSKLKKLVRQVLKDSLDHALLIPVSSKAVDFSENDDGELWKLHVLCKMTNTDSRWEYICPSGSVYPMRCVTIRPDAVGQELARLLRHRLPNTVSDVKINLREEQAEVTTAFFRYTHGIAGHKGLCQRLFHGHRSRFEVFINEERRPDLEHKVVRDLLGGEVHIATPSQFVRGMIEPGMRGKVGESVELRFRGSLGLFTAVLPADRVFVVEHETSIESIARQLANHVKGFERKGSNIRVVAYEGIGKGSMATRLI